MHISTSTSRRGFGAPKRPWGNIATGILIGLGGFGMYLHIGSEEAGGGVISMPLVLAKLYELGGKTMVAGFFELIAVALIGMGVVELTRRALVASPPVTVSQNDLNTLLMPALDFSAEELALNRDGQLSLRQREQLTILAGRSRRATVIASALVALILAAIGAYVFFFAPTSAALRYSMAANSTMATVVPLTLAIAVLVLGGSLVFAFLRSTSLYQGKVREVAGPVRLREVATRAMQQRIMLHAAEQVSGRELRMGAINVRGVRFYVPRSALNALKDGAVYRFYYVANGPTPVLLSAEALAAA